MCLLCRLELERLLELLAGNLRDSLGLLLLLLLLVLFRVVKFKPWQITKHLAQRFQKFSLDLVGIKLVVLCAFGKKFFVYLSDQRALPDMLTG